MNTKVACISVKYMERSALYFTRQQTCALHNFTKFAKQTIFGFNVQTACRVFLKCVDSRVFLKCADCRVFLKCVEWWVFLKCSDCRVFLNCAYYRVFIKWVDCGVFLKCANTGHSLHW